MGALDPDVHGRREGYVVKQTSAKPAPYSKREKKWLEKAWEEMKASECRAVCLLCRPHVFFKTLEDCEEHFKQTHNLRGLVA
jgi:hypothetical protein